MPLDRRGHGIDPVREAKKAPNGPAALATLFRYLLVTNREDEPEVIVERLPATIGEEGNEEIQPAGEKLIERGQQEAIQKSPQEGLPQSPRESFQKGILNRHRELLLKLLRTRFGQLPDSVVARVNAADLAALDRWFERAIAASALAAVFDEA